jgi:hypothetical protein
MSLLNIFFKMRNWSIWIKSHFFPILKSHTFDGVYVGDCACGRRPSARFRPWCCWHPAEAEVPESAAVDCYLRWRPSCNCNWSGYCFSHSKRGGGGVHHHWRVSDDKTGIRRQGRWHYYCRNTCPSTVDQKTLVQQQSRLLSINNLFDYFSLFFLGFIFWLIDIRHKRFGQWLVRSTNNFCLHSSFFYWHSLGLFQFFFFGFFSCWPWRISSLLLAPLFPHPFLFLFNWSSSFGWTQGHLSCGPAGNTWRYFTSTTHHFCELLGNRRKRELRDLDSGRTHAHRHLSTKVDRTQFTQKSIDVYFFFLLWLFLFFFNSFDWTFSLLSLDLSENTLN